MWLFQIYVSYEMSTQTMFDNPRDSPNVEYVEDIVSFIFIYYTYFYFCCQFFRFSGLLLFLSLSVSQTRPLRPNSIFS